MVWGHRRCRHGFFHVGDPGACLCPYHALLDRCCVERDLVCRLHNFSGYNPVHLLPSPSMWSTAFGIASQIKKHIKDRPPLGKAESDVGIAEEKVQNPILTDLGKSIDPRPIQSRRPMLPLGVHPQEPQMRHNRVTSRKGNFSRGFVFALVSVASIPHASWWFS